LARRARRQRTCGSRARPRSCDPDRAGQNGRPSRQRKSALRNELNMSKVTELTDVNFKSTLQNAKTPVLVDFSATWCGPCKALGPTIDKVASDYAGKLAVYKVDIDNAQDTAAGFMIQSVPTCIFFKAGKEVDRFYGNQDLRTVKTHVDKVLA
jgi:thioredoxin 1